MRILLALAFIICTVPAIAQFDSATITKTYTGILYSGTADKDGNIQQSIDGQAGVEGFAPLPGEFRLHFLGGLEAVSSSNPYAFGRFYFSKSLGERAPSVLAGWMPRSCTQFTGDVPLTSDGHFRFPATQVIPDCGAGVALASPNTEGISYHGGVYYLPETRAGEYNLAGKFSMSDLSIALATHWSTSRTGVSMKFISPTITAVGYVTNDSLQTALISYQSPWYGFVPYITGNHNSASNTFDYLEAG